jgi:GntR family histidine utilization transcriptional repressor
LIRVAPLQRAEHTVRALVPERRIRRLLKLEADEACLLIRRRTFSQGRVASVAELYHPGSRYELAANCQPR